MKQLHDIQIDPHIPPLMWNAAAALIYDSGYDLYFRVPTIDNPNLYYRWRHEPPSYWRSITPDNQRYFSDRHREALAPSQNQALRQRFLDQ